MTASQLRIKQLETELNEAKLLNEVRLKLNIDYKKENFELKEEIRIMNLIKDSRETYIKKLEEKLN